LQPEKKASVSLQSYNPLASGILNRSNAAPHQLSRAENSDLPAGAGPGAGLNIYPPCADRLDTASQLFDLPPLNRLFIDLKHFGSVNQPTLVGLLLKIDSYLYQQARLVILSDVTILLESYQYYYSSACVRR
jgi:hypothetical protein